MARMEPMAAGPAMNMTTEFFSVFISIQRMLKAVGGIPIVAPDTMVRESR